jgi:hypothetical protein
MINFAGLILSEMVTALLAVVVIAAVGFGYYVSGERDDMVERAEASLALVKARTTAAAKSDKPLVCDDSLVDADVLANAFIPLSIRPTKVVGSDSIKRYKPSIYVQSNREADGNDTFVSVERLYDALKDKGEYSISRYIKEEDDIEYSILWPGVANCSTPEQKIETATEVET